MKDNLVYETSDPSITICHDSKSGLYRAYYHDEIIFWSRDIERLKKRIKKMDKDFGNWYQKSDIHNQQ